MNDTARAAAPERPFWGIVAAAVITAGVTAGCTVCNLPQYVTSAAVAIALAVPSTVAFRWIRRRRDPRADLARLRSGRLERSAPLAVVLFALGVFSYDTALGLVEGALGLAGPAANVFFIVAGPVGALFLGLWASHYLGSHPYIATAIVMLVHLVLRLVVGTSTLAGYGALAYAPYWWGTWIIAAAILAVGAYGGVLVGRRGQAAFVARKADRLATRLRAGAPRPDAPPPLAVAAATAPRAPTVPAPLASPSSAPPPFAPRIAPLPPPRAEDRRLD